MELISQGMSSVVNTGGGACAGRGCLFMEVVLVPGGGACSGSVYVV